jgi:hypothetical protein
MINKNLVAALAVCALSAATLDAQDGPSVPAEYQDLYSSLSGYMADFSGTIDANWSGTKHPVTFTAQLSSANANTGPSMVQPSHYHGVLMELDGLRAMGVKGVLVEVPFPVLYRPFYENDADYQQYVSFYRKIGEEIRARGLTLIADSAFLLSRTGSANPGPFYKTLNWDQYVSGRVANTKAVLETMKPDYLIAVQEPDTEAVSTGQTQINTPAGATYMLNAILAGTNAVRGSTKIGAGVGSWHVAYADFLRNFTATTIDFIDIHLFEVNRKFLPQAVEIADMAAAAGKEISISGAWITKIRDSEVIPTALGLIPDSYIVARDNFSFWTPVDTEFLRNVVKFAHWKRASFITPFFGQYLRAYIPYSTATQDLSPYQLHTLERQEHVKSMQAGMYSSTGVAYSRAILPASDTIAPAAPGNPSALAGWSSNVTLWWSVSTDNVGVAGYTVLRNGVAIGQTSRPYYQDTGLARNTTYTYQFRAFDVAGNVSSTSASVSATTR